MESNSNTFEFAPTESTRDSHSQLLFAWRRKGFVTLALAIGLGLGGAYYLQADPVYESTAQILIIEERAKLPIEGVEVSMSSEQIHIMLLQSQVVIESALQLGQLGRLASLQGNPDPATAIMENLSVQDEAANKTTGTVLLRLSYGSTSRDDCPKVLEAIVRAYERFLSDMNQDVSNDALALIVQAKNDLDAQISKTEAAYRAMRDESPLLLTDETGLTLHEAKLLRIEEARSAAELEVSKLRAQAQSLEAALSNSSRDALNLIVGTIDIRDGFIDTTPESVQQKMSMEQQIVPLITERARLSNRFGGGHPRMRAIDRQIELMRHLADTLAERSVESHFELYLAAIGERIKMQERMIVEMSDLIEKERLAAKSVAQYQVMEETFTSEIDRKSRMFETVLQRLEEISLAQGRSGADVKTVNRPTPGIKIAPSLFRVMLMSAVLGLLCGIGLAFAVDEADRRFRSPEEIREEFGVPVIGHVPVIDFKGNNKHPDECRLNLELCTHHAPEGRIAESYRAVRTALYFSTRGSGQRVIQVTSPSPGDGKTTLAANLAISIAHSGKKTLLIDADFRRPRCHQVFGTENEVGMSSLIEGTAEFVDAVQVTEVENLDLLSCGARPSNPSELLTSPRFDELLELFREKYDIVIVDSPPVLVVTDPLNVAPRVDAVLLVLKLNKTARQLGRQTLEALEEVGAKVLGVVVNGVGGDSSYGGSGYTQYKYKSGTAYGYGRGHRYGDRYGYGDDEDGESASRSATRHIAPRNGNGSPTPGSQ